MPINRDISRDEIIITSVVSNNGYNPNVLTCPRGVPPLR
jgi:hypothetical protein